MLCLQRALSSFHSFSRQGQEKMLVGNLGEPQLVNSDNAELDAGVASGTHWSCWGLAMGPHSPEGPSA